MDPSFHGVRKLPAKSLLQPTESLWHMPKKGCVQDEKAGPSKRGNSTQHSPRPPARHCRYAAAELTAREDWLSSADAATKHGKPMMRPMMPHGS